MKRYRHILLLALLLLTMALNAQNSNYFIHTVDKGQTLYSISRMYHKNIQEIVALNPGCDVKLSIGQELRIPQTPDINKLQPSQAKKETRYHTIQIGETLYRLGKMYGVTPLEICEANPGLTMSNFRAGEVILIPESKQSTTTPAIEENKQEQVEAQPDELPQEQAIRTTHKVEKGETFYGIARKYGISEAELRAANPEAASKKKLKRKTILNIPYPAKKIEPRKNIAELTNREIFNKIEKRKDSITATSDKRGTRVAVILPFMLDSYAPNEQTRMVEYYQGFLMAVEKLKKYGYSYEIHTYDSGPESKSLTPLLQSGKLDNMNLIIGALYPGHNKELAKFANEKNIPLVIPFTSKEDEIFSNPMVYVVNTLQSYFFSEVIDHFTKKFPRANVIFVSDSTKSNKKDFIASLTEGLDRKKIPHATISMENIKSAARNIAELTTGSPNITALKEVMSNERENVFIPLSSSASTLASLVPSLILLKNDTINIPEFKLFGYPEWQIYANDMRAQLYEADTYFYASFFSHYSLPEAARFQSEYTRWYDRNLQNIYPRYGMLGYDTGYLFLLAANKFGNKMPDKINNVSFTPVQTGFKFERVNNWGGMVNKKIYFIHYTPDYNIEKIDFDK
ncbi:MAG: LysM peptidoglycan-binding domain-containing protein [Bacteroidaceae bacterium]|nr:LysM peptidoglycan-binding domain-containing protein [Bacteroidaceae bacterium]